MLRSLDCRALFAAVMLAAAVSLSTVPAGASSPRLAGGAPAVSSQLAQVTIADDQSSSWFSPWCIHRW